ncbi:hypothetical protein FE782_08070 [Paenibacillus antri]|uniref:Uncharacterized protein n=1 Tax=Paenibacillus antri TaxID=2582848 RepID=A0A5R9G854_9BACL|nr:hypothetical protein [Paenibacillus antri]TLS52582.1 hypothetical protein FE782_08070 [Paenibacillus antri]
MMTFPERTQQERRQQFYNLYLSRMYDAIDERGEWRGRGPTANFREKLWHCLPLLYAGGAAANRANAIIESLETRYCHFSPMTSMQLLLKYADRLTDAAAAKLRKYVLVSLDGAAEQRIRFPMYNDNFAALATFTLLTAGETFNKPDAFAAGETKLMQLIDVFRRRGTLMEFGSPTYTPITTHVLAEIVNHVKDERIRELALQCEARMWAEIAIHYHPTTGHFAGPYSRAYLVDSVAHPHNVHGLLHLVFGEAVSLKPIETLFPVRTKQVEHIGVETLMLPNLAWLYSGDCHCPPELEALALRKPLPFDAVATAECLPGEETAYAGEAAEHPAWSGPNTIRMTADYALGTSAGQFYDGAISDSFHAVYRTRPDVRDWTDTRAVFSRYFFNEREPGRENVYNGKASGPEMLRDEGRKFSIQHRNCALVAYRPKPYEAKRATSMKLSVVFPVHFTDVDQVWFGERRASLAGDAVEAPVPIYIEDGPVYFAFLPLAVTNAGRTSAVKLERFEEYLLLSFYNYEGPARAFEPKEAALLTNGFVVHVGSAAEHGSFESFRRHAAAGSLRDETTHQLEGYTRRIRYEHPDVTFDFAYSPRSEGVLYASVNGRPRPEPRFEATGYDAARLPL